MIISSQQNTQNHNKNTIHTYIPIHSSITQTPPPLSIIDLPMPHNHHALGYLLHYYVQISFYDESLDQLPSTPISFLHYCQLQYKPMYQHSAHRHYSPYPHYSHLRTLIFLIEKNYWHKNQILPECIGC